jgi:prolipoprotein diacylglyceryltransferase
MTGYYIKQALFMILGFVVGVWFASRIKPNFDINNPKDFDSLLLFSTLGAGAGWFVAFATGKPKGDEE